MRRWGSRVEFLLITAKMTSPGESFFKPSVRLMSLHPPGKILDTYTRLQAAMPADRSANSKLESSSRCLPTPRVRKTCFGKNISFIQSAPSQAIRSLRKGPISLPSTPQKTNRRAHRSSAKKRNKIIPASQTFFRKRIEPETNRLQRGVETRPPPKKNCPP